MIENHQPLFDPGSDDQTLNWVTATKPEQVHTPLAVYWNHIRDPIGWWSFSGVINRFLRCGKLANSYSYDELTRTRRRSWQTRYSFSPAIAFEHAYIRKTKRLSATGSGSIRNGQNTEWNCTRGYDHNDGLDRPIGYQCSELQLSNQNLKLYLWYTSAYCV